MATTSHLSPGEKLAAASGDLERFAFEDLDTRVQDIAASFAEQARRIVLTVPKGARRTEALEHLHKARAACVRAVLEEA